MKSTLFFILLLSMGGLYAEEITINITLQDGIGNIEWQIEKSNDGVVIHAVKIQVADGSILASLTTSIDGDTIISEYSNNQYHYTQKIMRSGEDINVQYSTVNNYLKMKTDGFRSLRCTSSGFQDMVDGKLVRQVEILKNRILNAAGEVLMQRIDDTINNYEMETKIFMTRIGNVTELAEQNNSPIVSPAKMRINGTLRNAKQSANMLNYCILPNELRFLFFIP
jgi:hypothetical protein